MTIDFCFQTKNKMKRVVM